MPLTGSEDSKDVSMVWTLNASPAAVGMAPGAFTATAPAPVPEPSSAMLLVVLGSCAVRRSVPRNK